LLNNNVYINDKILIENYISKFSEYEDQSFIVPANQYFVLGDNRKFSWDSRSWGYVNLNLIIGKMIWKVGDK
jgi:signal peptidase I